MKEESMKPLLIETWENGERNYYLDFHSGGELVRIKISRQKANDLQNLLEFEIYGN